jgi:tRNA 2-selenouridine synthase SelU
MLINEKDVVILGGGSRAKEINALLSFLGIRVQGYMNINRGYARLDNFLVEKELSSITEETFFVIANSYINESISFLKRIALSRPSGKLNRYLVS